MTKKKSPLSKHGLTFQNKRDAPGVKETILARLRAGDSPAKAAAAAGVTRQSVNKWRKNDPDWAAAFAEAEDEGVDLLEDEARRRAVDGVDRDVYHQGEVVGQEKEYSDMLLGLLLKGRRPERYQPNKFEISGPKGGPIRQEVTLVEATQRLKDLGITTKLFDDGGD